MIMERLDELLKSCFKPKGSFHFRTLPELTDFVIEQGGILYYNHHMKLLKESPFEHHENSPEQRQARDIIPSTIVLQAFYNHAFLAMSVKNAFFDQPLPEQPDHHPILIFKKAG